MTAMDAYAVQALAIARDLVTVAHIPVFTAAPAPGTKIGFGLPPRWQQIKPEAARVDEWQPGWALCMVCGCGLDVIDVDAYAGGTESLAKLNGTMPRRYGLALTPSGGAHIFVASLGVRSKNALFTGIDIKAGDQRGTGRGFVFLAPTVRPSKVTGEPGQYRWC